MDVTFALSQYSDVIIVLSKVTLYYKQQWMQAARIVLYTVCRRSAVLDVRVKSCDHILRSTNVGDGEYVEDNK